MTSQLGTGKSLTFFYSVAELRRADHYFNPPQATRAMGFWASEVFITVISTFSNGSPVPKTRVV
jgi:hypothetical protein